tara:strand:+ start:524 stop:898 length:375 start_codon:yes stop_codon:yes gene_type:complete
MDLKFCENCNNLMDFCLEADSEQTDGQPIYICSRCSNISESKNMNHIKYDKQFKKQNAINTNEYLFLDNTLPTINNKNIKCINVSCKTHETNTSNIKYIKYDELNLKYLYLCNECGQKWTNTII